MSENLISEDVVDETTIDETVELDSENEIQDNENDANQDEDDSESVEDDNPAEPEVNPLEKKIDQMQHGFEKRIGKITAKWKTLEEENAQLKLQMQEQARPAEVQKDRSDFDSDEDWVNHLADNRAKAMLADQQKAYAEHQKAQTRQNNVESNWESKVAAVTDILPDFADVLNSMDDDVVLPAAAAAIVLESDVGPQLAYHFAKNPELIDKVQGMSERQVDRFIARLEYKVETEYASAPVKAAITKANKPTPKPSGKRGGNSSANESMEDYVAKRTQRRYGI